MRLPRPVLTLPIILLFAACGGRATSPSSGGEAVTETPAMRSITEGVVRYELDNGLTIVAELNAVQGRPVDLGGYYRPDFTRLGPAMRPSATFNEIIDSI